MLAGGLLTPFLVDRAMAQRSHVPQFGNWESGDNVPYTVYFDQARKGRGRDKLINPNDPEEDPDPFSDNSSSAQAPTSRAIPEPEEPTRQKPGRSTHDNGHKISLRGESTQ